MIISFVKFGKFPVKDYLLRIISMRYILVILFALASVYTSGQNYNFPYELSNPAKVYELPPVLDEISGISLIDEKRIACVQDELGQIFIYNMDLKEIERHFDFGKELDYEDIEIIGSDAYVLESDGDLHVVYDFLNENKRKTDKKELALESRNDCEGLCYQKATNSLLIACKGKAGLGKDNDLKGYRAVYRYSLEEEKLIEAPVMLVKIDNLLDYSNLNVFAKISYKLASTFDPNGDIRFQPSAIDIHPKSGYIYITSFVGGVLAVYDKNAHLVTTEKLDRIMFMQPEGLDFDKNGNMYISNESNGGKANILFFEWKGTCY